MSKTMSRTTAPLFTWSQPSDNFAISNVEITTAGVLTLYENPRFSKELGWMINCWLYSFRHCFRLAQDNMNSALRVVYNLSMSDYKTIERHHFAHTALRLHDHHPALGDITHYHIYTGTNILPEELRCLILGLVGMQSNKIERELIKANVMEVEGNIAFNTTVLFVENGEKMIRRFGVFFGKHQKEIYAEQQEMHADMKRGKLLALENNPADLSEQRYSYADVVPNFFCTALLSFSMEFLKHSLQHNGFSEKKSKLAAAMTMGALGIVFSLVDYNTVLVNCTSLFLLPTNQFTFLMSGLIFLMVCYANVDTLIPSVLGLMASQAGSTAATLACGFLKVGKDYKAKPAPVIIDKPAEPQPVILLGWQ